MAGERIRGRALQEIRKRHFSKYPLCVMCQQAGRIKAAADLDHIIPIHKGGEDVPGNRQGLCADCHEKKTRADLGQRMKTKTGIDGWPVSA